MKLGTKAAIIVAATGLAVAVAWAQGTVTLRLKPATGAKYQYKVSMNTSAGNSGPAAGMGMNGTYNQWFIVKSKNPKGTHFQIKVTNAKFTGGKGMNPKQIEDAVEKQVINATYSPLGAYVTGDVNMGNMGAMAAQAGLQGIIFPQAAVKVGSSWTASVDIGKIMTAAGAQGMKIVSGGKVPVKYKITGFKMVGAKRVAGVSASMNGIIVMAMGQGGQSQGQMKLNMKATSTFQLDTSSGMIRTSTTNANVGTTFGNMNMNQTIKMTMTLI